MEHVYAAGIYVIERLQEWFHNHDNYFKLVNNIANPNIALEVLYPLLSVIDSVFAAQLLLCCAFGNWLNTVMKWWLLEDRPFWWVRTTDYYPEPHRPKILQFHGTCETGPGSPSGHCQCTAMVLVLLVLWTLHFINDRKINIWWWKLILMPLCTVSMCSVMLARLFIGSHFPHQVLLGSMLGALISPALCIYISDPYIWRYGYHASVKVSRTVKRHVAAVLAAILIGVATYFGLKLSGHDPQWSIKLAFRWCENPDTIHVSTTPIYALSTATGYLLGWALFCTPVVAQYRHYTKDRSLIISAILTLIYIYIDKELQQRINRDNAILFYLSMFLICAVKVPVLLRVIPSLAKWPYIHKTEKVKTN